MKRTFMMVAAAVPVLAMVAAAQQDTRSEARSEAMRRDLEVMQSKLKAELDSAMTQMKVVGVSGAAMGPTVKGAPYSAVEVSENNQVLADGTRIHNESRTSVYRDSEGRVRRETPTQITIMDPVAGTSYFLNPKTMTATKANLAMPMAYRRVTAAGGGGGAGTFAFGTGEGVAAGAVPFSSGGGGRVAAAGGTFSAGTLGGIVGAGPGENATFEVRTGKDGEVSVTVNGKPADPATVQFDHLIINPDHAGELAMADKMKVEAMAKAVEAGVSAGAGGVLRTRVTAPGKTEALGKQMMEGVNADGTRFTTTLDTGAVGNDRPIQMINERWYSSDLQTVMMTRHSDPRTGEELFRLINVSRSEPGADLFQVPTSYTINDRITVNDRK